MNRESRLQRTADAASKQLRKIADARARRENRKLVGKCFKWRNKYSCDNDGWWLYGNVLSGGVRITGLVFEVTGQGRCEVSRDHMPCFPGWWVEITRAEFDREWRRFMVKVAGMNG